MNDFKEKLNIEVKARVKVNIYKTLLEEEKQKNKRNNVIGLSLFIVGIVSTSALYQIKDVSQPKNIGTNQGLVQTVDTEINENNLPKYLEVNNTIEMNLFDESLLEGKELSNVKEEDFFVSDFKM